MKRNWRAGRLGWLLNIHSPVGHALEDCWCIGTKRELVIPNFMTRSMAMADLKLFADYFDAMIAYGYAYDNYVDMMKDHPELIVSRDEFFRYINTAHERQKEQDNA